MKRVVFILSTLIVLFSCKSDKEEIKTFKIEISIANTYFDPNVNEMQFTLTQDSIFLTYYLSEIWLDHVDTINLDPKFESIKKLNYIYSYYHDSLSSKYEDSTFLYTLKKELDSKKRIKIIEALKKLDYKRIGGNLEKGHYPDKNNEHVFYHNLITINNSKFCKVGLEDIQDLTNIIDSLSPRFRIK